ncbi:MAG TPA: hypothetical protein VKD22_01195 [Ramlibacter sp.]|nr:hypothetical protein [Ramlibacter sp.]
MSADNGINAELVERLKAWSKEVAAGRALPVVAHTTPHTARNMLANSKKVIETTRSMFGLDRIRNQAKDRPSVAVPRKQPKQ